MSFEKWLADSGHDMISEMGTQITDAWTNTFKEWLAGASFSEYESAVEVVNIVLQAAESGDFSECAWVQKQDNEDMAEKLRNYQNIWIKLQTTHDVALALQSALKDVPSLKTDKDAVDAVTVNTSAIMKKKDTMRENLCVASFTTLLAANPAPADFPKKFDKLGTWAKSMGFTTTTLPKYIRNLHRAAMTSKPGALTDTSTADEASAASIAPSLATGSTAVPTEGADKKNRFSAAAKLLKKKA